MAYFQIIEFPEEDNEVCDFIVFESITPVNEYREFKFTVNDLTDVFWMYYQEFREISDDICISMGARPQL